MKFSAVTLSVLFLGSCNAGWYHYWCAKKGQCGNGKGQGPTYRCGKQVGFTYYESDIKKWWENGKDDIFTTSFIDCCIDAGKSACSKKWN